VARESSEIKQELEAKQDKREYIREECSTLREKCIAKRRIWERII